MSRFCGVVLEGDIVRYKGQGGNVAGATARVETAGEIERRYTATRIVLLGVFALAFKKSKDKRELYLTVEGPGYAFVVEVPPKKGAAARKFAAQINAKATRLAPSASTAAAVLAGQPAGWNPSPPPPAAIAQPPPPVAALPAAVPPLPALPAAQPAFPPGWLPDPTGRFQHRYWDGSRWTQHVATNGAAAVDPV